MVGLYLLFIQKALWCDTLGLVSLSLQISHVLFLKYMMEGYVQMSPWNASGDLYCSFGGEIITYSNATYLFSLENFKMEF